MFVEPEIVVDNTSQNGGRHEFVVARRSG